MAADAWELKLSVPATALLTLGLSPMQRVLQRASHVRQACWKLPCRQKQATRCLPDAVGLHMHKTPLKHQTPKLEMLHAPPTPAGTHYRAACS